jgi:hypothetical protein
MGRKALLLLTVMAALVMVSGTALAITYTTSKRVSLKLNKPNYVGTALTRLASNAVGPALTLETDSTDPSATPLKLDTETGSQAPLSVDSFTKVANLNADMLDGRNSSEFARATTDGTGKAEDSDKLDGKDSTQFVQGVDGVVDIAPGTQGQVLRYSGSFGTPDIEVRYNCPSTLSNNGTLTIVNQSPPSGVRFLYVFSDNGGDNPNVFTKLNSSQTLEQEAAASGEHITLQVQMGAGTGTIEAGVGTIEVFSVHRSGFDNDCYVQAQGLFTSQ